MIKIKFELTFNEKKPGEKLKKFFKPIRSAFKKKVSPALVFSTIVLSCILALGINLAFAWTDAPDDPITCPAGYPGCDAPINVSGTAQTKAGNLTVRDAYVNSWFRNNNASTGLYNQSTASHFYSQDGNYWVMDSNRGLIFRDGYGGAIQGYTYYDDSGNFGLLSPNGNWRVRVDNSNTELYGGALMGTAYANILYDRNNTGYYVDPASTSRLNYGVYDNLYSYGWMQAPIFYDANNNGYYVDPASTSKFNTINLGGVSRSTWPSATGDGNNYPTGISFSGSGTKTLTLTRSGLSNLTASFTDKTGITAESDTLDSVCDRGHSTNQDITTGGSVRAGNGDAIMQSDGSIVADRNIKVGVDLIAEGNSWGRSQIKSAGNAYGGHTYVQCNQGYYVRAFEIHDNGKIWKFYCSKL